MNNLLCNSIEKIYDYVKIVTENFVKDVAYERIKQKDSR